MTTKQSEPETPLERFKTMYVPLYRVLLVLGFLSVIISLPGVLNIRQILDFISTDPYYAASGLVSVFIVLPLMISSLFLLAQKHPTGIQLRLGGYAASIIAAVLGLFTSRETILTLTRDTVETTARSNAGISHELALQITEITYSTLLYISIAIALLFAWLWWTAWKKQMKADTKKSKKDNATN